MKYFWFGDSWVFGDELDKTHSDFTSRTFASLVSKHYGAECINLGQCGASIDDIPLKFFKIINSLAKDDVVFFCLTANHRVSLFDENNMLKHISILPMYEKHNPHQYATQWFKYFDTPAQRIYNYDRLINLLFLWCQKLEVRCWFANIFTIEIESIIDIVPEEFWLIPKNSCLAKSILPVIDKDYLFLDDHPNLSNDQWSMQQIAIEKYIKPNWQHPNQFGHEKIAEMIIKRLSNEDTSR